VLKALDVSMTEEAVTKILERRSDPKLGGPFKDDKDFLGFASALGVNVKSIEESKVPLLYEIEYNFRIIATGLSSNVKREITAITYDYANLTARMTKLLDEQDASAPGALPPTPPATPPATPGTPAQSPGPKVKSAKGRPTVVYWEEN